MFETESGRDSIGVCAEAIPPPIVRSRTVGGMNAVWVDVAREPCLGTAPEFERTVRKVPLACAGTHA
jgi:hypothetical protein